MDFSKAIEDNLHDHLFVSNYDKESFKDIELCLGIDEAGRGPVLGILNKSAVLLFQNF